MDSEDLRVEDRFLLEQEDNMTFGWFLQLREIENWRICLLRLK